MRRLGLSSIFRFSKCHVDDNVLTARGPIPQCWVAWGPVGSGTPVFMFTFSLNFDLVACYEEGQKAPSALWPSGLSHAAYRMVRVPNYSNTINSTCTGTAVL